MKDSVVTVEKNDLGIEKVYFNNILVSNSGEVTATLTCVDAKEKKVQTEVSKVNVMLTDVLLPAGLRLLGLTSAEVKTAESDEELLEAVEDAQEEIKKLQNLLSEKNTAFGNEKKRADDAEKLVGDKNKEIESAKEVYEGQVKRISELEKEITDLKKPAVVTTANKEAEGKDKKK